MLRPRSLLLTSALLFSSAGFSAGTEIQHNTVDQYLKTNQIAGHKPNSLIEQSSPYLLQHAYNPVDWYAWGDEAFAQARKQDKPIFLSIGYSTCHWCHVMAHESFEDVAIAKVLNDHFISIKIDREERPDIDNVYMMATQLINGHGGWPMTVFIDHDLQPFHAGTYYPPESRDGHTGLKQLLLRVNELWQQDRKRIGLVADAVTKQIKSQADEVEEVVALEKTIKAQALEQISQSFDTEFGGFSAAPKFPRPGIFTFLLSEANTDKVARNMIDKTLNAMSRGGIYDQLGGGFHRYSVDAEWQVPHFEKMLYTQAMMVMAYAELYELTRTPPYLEIIEQTLTFVTREMQHSDGGFYSALDADSLSLDEQADGKKTEGAFYLWRADQVKKILSKREWDLLESYYGVSPDGNIYSDPFGEFKNLNIFFVEDGAVRLSTQQRSVLNSAKQKLLSVRESRPRPHLDDKIITAWNGMMIKAIVVAVAAGADKKFMSAAFDAAEMIERKLLDKKKFTLMRRSRGDDAGVTASLSDYVWYGNALLALHEHSSDKKWLHKAIRLTETQIDLFYDLANGGFFESVIDENVLFRSRSAYDGALPSPNAVAMNNLILLSELDTDERWDEYFEQSLAAFSSSINASPASAAWMLSVIPAR